MGHWPVILISIAAVYGLISLGASLRGLNWLTAEADDSLVKLVVRILYPCLIFHSIVRNEALQNSANLIYPPLVGFGTGVVGMAIAWVAARTFGPALGFTEGRQHRTFAICVGLYNYGFVPIPLVQDVFHADGGLTLGVLFVHNLGVEVAVWTVGILVITGELGEGWWKRLLNPPIAALIVGATINLAGLSEYIPALADKMIGMLAACSIPTALLLIGATLADHLYEANIKQGTRAMAAACLLRLGLLPVGFLLLAAYVPGSIELKRVIVIEAAMPSAVFPIVLSKHYGGDPATAVRVVLATSIVGLITMPAWLAFGLPYFDLLPP